LTVGNDDESSAFASDSNTTDGNDPEIVLANGSESSGEGKVVASSIDGEDGLVDVTMKDAQPSPEDATSALVGEASM
jgi:hypothetical protein